MLPFLGDCSLVFLQRMFYSTKSGVHALEHQKYTSSRFVCYSAVVVELFSSSLVFRNSIKHVIKIQVHILKYWLNFVLFWETKLVSEFFSGWFFSGEFDWHLCYAIVVYLSSVDGICVILNGLEYTVACCPRNLAPRWSSSFAQTWNAEDWTQKTCCSTDTDVLRTSQYNI